MISLLGYLEQTIADYTCRLDIETSGRFIEEKTYSSRRGLVLFWGLLEGFARVCVHVCVCSACPVAPLAQGGVS